MSHNQKQHICVCVGCLDGWVASESPSLRRILEGVGCRAREVKGLLLPA